MEARVPVAFAAEVQSAETAWGDFDRFRDLQVLQSFLMSVQTLQASVADDHT